MEPAAGALAAGSPAGATSQGAYSPIATAPFYEGSGVVASRAHPGVFWALQDSGGPARTVLHAFKVQGGRLVDLRPGVRFRTVRVEGTTNRDWEALSTDSRGNLWVGDVGNNGCTRSDLRVHRVPEPNPFSATSVRVAATYPVAWPDPAGRCTGYDAESLFVVDGGPYVIAKLAPRPGVYRVPTASTTARNRLQKVGELTPPPNRDGAPRPTPA